MTQASCQPASPHWLTHLGAACATSDETQMVLGLTRFVDGKGWNGLRSRFFRTWQQMLHLPYAQRYGAYRCQAGNLCYRRSLFLSHRGFAEYSNLLTGATDIMVNHHSTTANTVLCLHPEAFVHQETPQYGRWWAEERLFFIETRRHFHRRYRYRLTYLGHVALTVLFTLATLAAVGASLLLRSYWLTGLIALLWLVHAAVRSWSFHVGSKSLGEPSFRPLLPLLLHLVPWWDATAWVQWLFTNRQTFQKKFI